MNGPRCFRLHPGDLEAVEAPSFFQDRHEIAEHLAGMEAVGQGIDDRDVPLPGHAFKELLEKVLIAMASR